MAPAETGGGGGGAVEGEHVAVLDDPDADEIDPDADPEAVTGDEGDDEPGEITVSLGGPDGEEDEEAEEEAIAESLGDQPANVAFAKLRKTKQDLKRALADTARRNRELEEKLQAQRPVEAAIVVGKEPDIDEYEDEYGTLTAEKKAQFKVEHAAWAARKVDADAQQKQRDAAALAQNQAWQARIDAVEGASATLGVTGQKEARQTFETLFSGVQQGIIVGAIEDPKASALMRYALGRNPAVARKLAAIQDPVKFAVAVGKLESQMKVTSKKGAPPAPERRLSSGKAGVAATGDQLDRLRAEADKTGDRSKVVKYMREQSRKAA